MLPISSFIICRLSLHLHPGPLSLCPLSGLNILGVPADGVSMTPDGGLKLSIMRDPLAIAIDMRLLLAHDHSSLIINSILHLIFTEVISSMTHRLKHNLMLNLRSPNLFLLLLYLVRSLVGVRHMTHLLKQLGFYLRGGVGDHVARLGLNLAVFIPPGFLLRVLLLLLVRVGGIGAE